MRTKTGKLRVGVIVAIIGLVGALFVAISTAIAPIMPSLFLKETEIEVLVTDSSGQPVQRARALLFYSGGAKPGDTDINGKVTMIIDASKNEQARLIVQTRRYEIYEEEIQLPVDQPIIVRLQDKDPSMSNVIVHVIGNADNNPVASARVTLLVNGNPYVDVTDSNGVAVFKIPFYQGEVNSEISVDASNFGTEYQNVTLSPNIVQDIRLDPKTGIVLGVNPYSSNDIVPTMTPTQIPPTETPTPIPPTETLTPIPPSATPTETPSSISLSGDWRWEINPYWGYFHITQNGNSFTGTLDDEYEGTRGDKIVDGEIIGNSIKFTREGRFGIQYWEGTVSESNSTLIITGRWKSGEFGSWQNFTAEKIK
jgi:hypothetical protein